jgi:polar amino acid transport system permease protein
MSVSIKPSGQEFRRLRLSELPWWAFVIGALGMFLVYLILSNADYRATFEYLLAGVSTTLRITLLAFPIATVIGLATGLARTTKSVFLNNLAMLYIETVRGIPLIVIVLAISFGIVPALVEVIHNIGEWGKLAGIGPLSGLFTAFAEFNIRNISLELRAIIALSVGYGAFEAEVFRAGIQSIGRGQMEAARSLGMTYIQAMRYIILPQAIRRVLPPLGNDFIALLKDTSLLTVLAVPELTQLSRLRRAATFRYMETYNVVAFLYLSMTLMLSAAVRGIERLLKIEE